MAPRSLISRKNANRPASKDAGDFLARARNFLRSHPALHTVPLTGHPATASTRANADLRIRRFLETAARQPGLTLGAHRGGALFVSLSL
jgi:hypothetical protein